MARGGEVQSVAALPPILTMDGGWFQAALLTIPLTRSVAFAPAGGSVRRALSVRIISIRSLTRPGYGYGFLSIPGKGRASAIIPFAVPARQRGL